MGVKPSPTLSRLGSFEQFDSNYSVIPLRNDVASHITQNVFVNTFMCGRIDSGKINVKCFSVIIKKKNTACFVFLTFLKIATRKDIICGEV